MIFSLTLFCVVFCSIIQNSRASYSNEIIIDGRRDGDYTLIMSANYWPLYMANNESHFFFYIKHPIFSDSDRTLTFETGLLRIDISNETVNTNYIQSVHVSENSTLEFSILKDLISEQQIITITIKEKYYIRGQLKFLPRFFQKSVSTGVSGWGWSMIVFLLLIGFLIAQLLQIGLRKKIVKAYKINEVNAENQNVVKSFTKLQTIGELKFEKKNDEKRCYEFHFSLLLKNFVVYSNQPWGTYQENHCIDRIAILYFIRGAIFEKKLQPKDYYTIELDWSIQSRIYRYISFCFNLSPSGMVISSLICGTVFWFFLGSIAFFIGCGVGLGISAINWLLRTQTKIVEPLMKKQKRLIETEKYMAPLESEEELYEVYKVSGTREVIRAKADGAEEKVIETLQDNNDVDYLTVDGYDELYQLEQDPRVKIKKRNIIGIKRRQRTSQEMMNLHRSYLARNRALVEDNFTLKEQNVKLEQLLRDLHVKLQVAEEDHIREYNEYGMFMLKEKEWQKNTIKRVFAEIQGAEFISENWEDALSRVMRMVENERQETKANTMNILIKSVKDLINVIGQKAELDVTQIKSLLNKIRLEDGEDLGTKTEG